MGRKISNIFINNLLAQTNIIDLINSKIELKKKGKNHYACCPFHHEKKPSFTVNKNKQFYYCFGCGAHGNAIDFLMNYNKFNFVESIEELATINQLNIQYEKNNDTYQIEQKKRQNIYKLMKHINQFYTNSLNTANVYQAKKYLIKRGLNDEIIDQFSIGFAPNGWNNIIQYLKKYTSNSEKITETGMLITTKNGHTYDLFRHRITFPIRDQRGRIIAFGGRVLDNQLPKYLNSLETEIFHKHRQLYGLYEVLKNNKKLSKILVVEGYMDVIALNQFGIQYSVASLGTTITKEHIQLLFRNTDTIICCYDGDPAGYQAAWRTLEIAINYLQDGYQIKFVFLPHGEDPDSLIRKEGKKKFEKRIIEAHSFSKFLFDTLIKKINLQTYQGKAKFKQFVISFIKKIPGDIIRLHLAEKLGHFINIPDITYILSMIKKELPKKQYQIPKIKITTMRILIALLIQNPHFVHLINNINEIEDSKLPGVTLFLELVNLCQSNNNINTGQLLEYYRNNKFIKQLEKLATWTDIQNQTSEKIFKDALQNLFIRILDEKLEFLIMKARTKGLTKEERKKVCFMTLSKINNPTVNHA
ncbi:DNA primase [Arsenophonus symbiont of Ornithomya chloropus]|uniref:DNA primase n=1 Tax=Arsenophonus symbiont of Ornithomya chloropus TaxID=634121 RepID=UPI0032B29C15